MQVVNVLVWRFVSDTSDKRYECKRMGWEEV